MGTPRSTDDLDGADEDLLLRFEQAWHGGQRPDLADYAPRAAGRTPLLVELAHVDLEFRLRGGEEARVETYLDRFPVLKDDRGRLLELVLAEYLHRRRRGSTAEPEEYQERFPEYRAELPGRLAAVVVDDDNCELPTHPTTPEGRRGTSRPEFQGYEILAELGRGGMGIVYRARQWRPERLVAVKTLLAGQAAPPDDIARFRREAEAIAHLDHPHIVPVYEVGAWGDPPVPYFTMKLYTGGSLATTGRGPGTDPTGHARLVETVARAVHHAHQRGILHRDLKPANVLLDDAGQPHVADFGLAKRFDPGATPSLSSGVVGTPSYMAPEQATGTQTVTTAGDVYSLGAILYELLTGRPPFLGENALATLLQATEHAPERLRVRNPQVPADLEVICLKCLEKEPGQRYGSALALAEDLERFCTGQTILARPAGAWERGRRWARRHPLTAALALASGLAVVLLFVSLVVGTALIASKQAETVRALADAQEARSALAQTLESERRQVYLSSVPLAHRLWSNNQVSPAEWHLDRCADHLRGWEWHYLDTLRRARPEPLGVHPANVTGVAFFPDGTRLVSADQAGTVKIWDRAAGKELASFRGTPPTVHDLALSPDGRLLATVGEQTIALRDLAGGREVYHGPGSYWVAFHPDGTRIATGVGKDVVVRDIATGKTWKTLTGHTTDVSCGAFHPDGKRFVSGGGDHTVRFWDLESGRPAAAPYPVPAHTPCALRYTPDGGRLLVGLQRKVVMLDVATGRAIAERPLRAFAPSVVAVSPDGHWIASPRPDDAIELWAASGEEPGLMLRGNREGCCCVAFHPNGRFVAFGGDDGSVRIWDRQRARDHRTLATFGSQPVAALTFRPDGQELAAAGRRLAASDGGDDAVCLLALPGGSERRGLKGANGVTYSPEGRLVATGSLGGDITLWDAASGQPLQTWHGFRGPCAAKEFTPDGKRLLTAGDDGTVVLWDPTTGQEVWRAARLTSDWRHRLALSPDGHTLAAVQRDGLIGFWDADTGNKVRTVKAPHHTRCLTFAPDGTHMVSGGMARGVVLWNASTGETVRSFHGHNSTVGSVAFNADGSRLVSGGDDRTVRVWDVPSGQELLTLPGVTGPVTRVAVSPDGRRIAAADSDVRLWEIEANRP